MTIIEETEEKQIINQNHDGNDKSIMVNELVVFDFDETIVDCNSDLFINALAPNQQIPKQFWQPDIHENDWTDYMQQVFIYLHHNGCTEKDYQKCLIKMPFVSGIKDLLFKLSKDCDRKRFESIIISDANSFFIKHFLVNHNLLNSFKEIFTNPAHFDDSGCLRIKQFHRQNWCQLSAKNLCKGHILKEYIAKRSKEQVHFDRISYVGDGSNDLCPALRLSERDLVFARYNFPLHRKAEGHRELQAQLIPFVDGDDIWKVICNN
ncbi:putative phosphatase phospho2 [Sarcoptes scabiei]|uniref:Putative phosphatase phospho2 n=2 Tax=Sarcoptes scabiei TaxID=52283 RepID=A0A834RE49_SARSC|nr:putative phosphatase phospho2 [Sarcoptes scabiei]UXI23291.1 hypothetical protein NH340_JMT09234 [Sarcoptes scabiei]